MLLNCNSPAASGSLVRLTPQRGEGKERKEIQRTDRSAWIWRQAEQRRKEQEREREREKQKIANPWHLSFIFWRDQGSFSEWDRGKERNGPEQMLLWFRLLATCEEWRQEGKNPHSWFFRGWLVNVSHPVIARHRSSQQRPHRERNIHTVKQRVNQSVDWSFPLSLSLKEEQSFSTWLAWRCLTHPLITVHQVHCRYTHIVWLASHPLSLSHSLSPQPSGRSSAFHLIYCNTSLRNTYMMCSPIPFNVTGLRLQTTWLCHYSLSLSPSFPLLSGYVSMPGGFRQHFPSRSLDRAVKPLIWDVKWRGEGEVESTWSREGDGRIGWNREWERVASWLQIIMHWDHSRGERGMKRCQETKKVSYM